jgi:hypothetical protein
MCTGTHIQLLAVIPHIRIRLIPRANEKKESEIAEKIDKFDINIIN